MTIAKRFFVILALLFVGGKVPAVLGQAKKDKGPAPAVNKPVDKGLDFLRKDKGPDPAVQQAVDKGLKFLRSQLPAGGGGRPGAFGLLGLTLLECGVSGKDADVQKVADMIRAAAPNLSNPYDIMPAILFLDRLHQSKAGAAGDGKLIHSLGLRLLAGQRRANLLWRYHVPILNADAEKKLLADIKDNTFQGLASDDHDMSCSQFAALGLWVARRHGAAVDEALRRAALATRLNQDLKSGTWNYIADGHPEGAFKDTATCCGIMLLALGQAAQDKAIPRAIFKDAAVDKALKHLDSVIKKNVVADRFTVDAHGTLYFLWALERTAMILGTKTIGEHDWHKWGSDFILGHQAPNGSWQTGNGLVPDTSFALLFLIKSNLFQDLTDCLTIVPGGGKGKPPNDLEPDVSPIREKEPNVEPIDPDPLKSNPNLKPPDLPGIPLKKPLDSTSQQAVERGVAYLRKQIPGILVNQPGKPALVGLALLEAGVPADDPDVQKLAGVIRRGNISVLTYEVSLSILFLDRLYKDRAPSAADGGLIQTLALRLIAGQTPTLRLWGYNAPVLNKAAEKTLLDKVRAAKAGPEEVPPPRNNAEAADISNSQFAVLALWAARRHDVPVDAALLAAAGTARRHQEPAGTWGYMITNANSGNRDSGTCVGLEMLALGQAAKPSPKQPLLKDVQVAKAIDHLQKSLRKGQTAEKGKQRFDAGGDLYFLWTLQRTALMLKLETIGAVDWHAWGSEVILAQQKADGSWSDRYPGVPDTCFAVLFLARSNLFADATERLHKK